MSLVYPGYLFKKRQYKCSRCNYPFIKEGMSAVKKCPMCEGAAYDINQKELDPYSKMKERWYTEKGRHEEEIRNRKTITRDNKKTIIVTDGQGRRIDDMPIIET